MFFFFTVAETNQSTTPAELPIFGDLSTEISLSLSFQKQQPHIFTLKGKRLQLNTPLDRDAENLSHVVFQVSSMYLYLLI